MIQEFWKYKYVHHHIGGLENLRNIKARVTTVHHHIGGLEKPMLQM